MAVKFKNVIVGKPIVHPWYMFCEEKEEWEFDKKDVYYTEERFLPRIMVDVGFVSSVSEVRRNKPELVRTLDKLDYLEVRWGKSILFILVGE